MDPEQRKLLGVQTQDEAFEKRSKLEEGKEHDIVMAWISRHELKCIHASCKRKVHDLEPGHPDFTLLHGNRFLFVEMKTTTKLKPDQVRVMLEHAKLGTDIHVTYSGDETIRLMAGWLWEHFRWTAQ